MTRRLAHPLLLAGLALLAWWIARPGASATAPLAAASAAAPLGADPLCRFSVNFLADEDEFDISPLRLGWYINYQALSVPTTFPGLLIPPEYAPIISMTQTGPNAADWTIRTPPGGDIAAVVAGNPGAFFLIGNEPDRRVIQDDLEPHVYAHAYHTLYHQIKALDPTARVVAGNIVQATELRLQYLDLVLAAYHDQFGGSLPADAWGVHGFILREETGSWGADIPPGINASQGELIEIDENDDLDRFRERLVRMRQWMHARGYRHVPLLMDEFGVLMPFDFGYPPERVNAFMNGAYDIMRTATDATTGYPYDGNKLVQRYSWYSSTDDPLDFNGRLWDPGTGQLTEVGQNYADYVAPIAGTVDLRPVELATTPAAPFSTGAPVNIVLTARVANQGNRVTIPGGQPILVRFYNGGALLGSQTIPDLAGCGETATVSLAWNNVPPGQYNVEVRVDPLNAIAESNEGNNVLSRTVFTVDRRTFLPATFRALP